MKKIVSNLLALVIIVLIIIFGYQNSEIVTGIHFMSGSAQLKVSLAIFISAFAGAIAGVVFMLQFILQKNTAVKAYERQLEKTSVSSDENSAKVKVLEAKIKTLEKALENATKKN